MSAKSELRRIFASARRDAFRVVKGELKTNLPKGWTVHFAVAWGFCVYDTQGRAVVGQSGTDHSLATRRQLRALSLAADFCDMFGYDNTTIVI